ncbi:MAG: type 1 glutamine amidotransferase [Deltaproteobacteria bacterium]|nr:type 1 glutamine amidotransferase [Deltaproteobacteria bacterium]
MRMHYLQHETFEDPAGILTWAKGRGFKISCTRLFAGDALPSASSFDWLVVMGGSMGVDDEDRYSWLREEKRFIGQAVESGAKVLGICLGAQLISHVLGGAVSRSEHQEIGWFPVTVTERGRSSEVFKGFPEEFVAFHWHGDTFETPVSAVCLAESVACRNQAFAYDGGRVVGLQFHLELDEPSIAKMAGYLEKKQASGLYVQSAADIRNASDDRFRQIEGLLYRMLDNMQAVR